MYKVSQKKVSNKFFGFGLFVVFWTPPNTDLTKCPKVSKLSNSAQKRPKCPKASKVSKSVQKCPKASKVSKSVQTVQKCSKASKQSKSVQICVERCPKYHKESKAENFIRAFFLGHPVDYI